MDYSAFNYARSPDYPLTERSRRQQLKLISHENTKSQKKKTPLVFWWHKKTLVLEAKNK